MSARRTRPASRVPRARPAARARRAPPADARGARFIAFLRAINVGGHVVPMARLRREFAALGFRGVETFIASGNVVFEADGADGAALEARIAARLERALGYPVATFVRTPAEVAAVAAYEAFPAAAVARAAAHCVGFLAEPLDRAAAAKLLALRSEVDALHVHGREFYWLSRVGQGRSELSNAVFEKTTGVQATLRGLNTVRRLAARLA